MKPLDRMKYHFMFISIISEYRIFMIKNIAKTLIFQILRSLFRVWIFFCLKPDMDQGEASHISICSVFFMYINRNPITLGQRLYFIIQFYLVCFVGLKLFLGEMHIVQVPGNQKIHLFYFSVLNFFDTSRLNKWPWWHVCDVWNGGVYVWCIHFLRVKQKYLK